ncbi:hypothetical protein Q6332_28055, partial [Klebsiella pneumoniae]|uniref:hypothetical protein n=1 Tax=Klebsiella pneumoniae TaxID=573 RepID=UPI00272F42D3
QRKVMPKNVQTTTQLHSSHTSKVMLKILQARLQQYINCELSDIQAGFIIIFLIYCLFIMYFFKKINLFILIGG